MGVKVDYSQLEQFSRNLRRLNKEQRELFLDDATRAMAGRLLALVIPRTPVGKGTRDADGHLIRQGGTLRRGWTASTEHAAESGGSGPGAAAYAAKLRIGRLKSGRNVRIVNPVHYASYVEYGHRQTPGRFVPAIGKQLVQSWAPGQFFLRISEDELRIAAPSILEPMLDAFLRRVF